MPLCWVLNCELSVGKKDAKEIARHGAVISEGRSDNINVPGFVDRDLTALCALLDDRNPHVEVAAETTSMPVPPDRRSTMPLLLAYRSQLVGSTI